MKKVTVLTHSASLSALSARQFGLCLLGALLLALSFPVGAQQPKKIPTIGWIAFDGSRPNRDFMTPLRELGYIEGQSVIVEYRSAQGREDDSLKSPTNWFVASPTLSLRTVTPRQMPPGKRPQQSLSSLPDTAILLGMASSPDSPGQGGISLG